MDQRFAFVVNRLHCRFCCWGCCVFCVWVIVVLSKYLLYFFICNAKKNLLYNVKKEISSTYVLSNSVINLPYIICFDSMMILLDHDIGCSNKNGGDVEIKKELQKRSILSLSKSLRYIPIA